MSEGIRIHLVQSPLIRRGTGDLRNLCRLHVDTPWVLCRAALRLNMGARAIDIALPSVPRGLSTTSVFIPVVDARVLAEASLSAVREEAGIPSTAASLSASESVWIETPRRWTVHLVPYSHHDYGYTDLPSRVFAQHRDYLDRAIELCDLTADEDGAAKYCYSIEESSSLVSWLEHAPAERRAALRRLVAAGRVEVTALFVNAITSLCSTEVMIRHLYPAAQAAAAVGARPTVAVQNDMPGMSWGLISLLHDIGVDSLILGIPSWYFAGRRSANGDQWEAQPWVWDEKGVLKRGEPGEMAWEGPDGRILRVYRNFHGGDEELYVWSTAQLENDLAEKLGSLAQSSIGTDVACFTVRGAVADNAPPPERVSETVKEWNGSWEWPQLCVSTHRRFLDAMPRMSQPHAVRGELPHTDYVIGALSAAKETAINRRSHAAAIAAEGISVLADLLNARRYPSEDLGRGFRDMLLFDSHCYGFYRTYGAAMDANWAEKACFAYRASAEFEDVIVKALAAIGDRLAPSGAGLYLAVVNTTGVAHAQPVRLPFSRPASIHSVFRARLSGTAGCEQIVLATAASDGVAAIPMEWSLNGVAVTRLGELTQRPSQSHTIWDERDADHSASERSIVAKLDRREGTDLVFDPGTLPPFGVAMYQVSQLPEPPILPDGSHHGPVAPRSASTANHPRITTLENDFYRISFDGNRGAIRSILDKILNVELLDPEASLALGALVSRTSPSGELYVHTSAEWSLQQSGAVFDRVVTHVDLFGRTATLALSLYHTAKRIDFDLRLPGDLPTLVSLHAPYPFLAQGACVRFEGTGAVVRPTTDCVAGAPKEYFAVQQWVEVADRQKRIVLVCRDSPVVSFGALNTDAVSLAHRAIPAGTDPPGGRLGSGGGHVYVYLTDNNFATNFRNAQTAPLVSAFTLTSSGADDENAAPAFGASVTTPAAAQLVSRDGAPGPSRGAAGSSTSGPIPLPWNLFSFDSTHATLTAVKRSEDGSALILRFWETAGKEADFVLTFDPGIVAGAEEQDVVENARPSPVGFHGRGVTDEGDGRIRIRVPAGGISTVRLMVDRAAFGGAS